MIRNNRVEEMGAEDPSVARFKCFYVVCLQRMRFRYNFYEKKTFSDRSDHSDHIGNHFPAIVAIAATTIAEIEKVLSR